MAVTQWPNIKFAKGDIFRTENRKTSLFHTISRELHMRKRIEKSFRSKFGRIRKLKRQQARVRGLCCLRDGERYLYHLVTKPRFICKPTYHSTVRNASTKKFVNSRDFGLFCLVPCFSLCIASTTH